MLRKLIAILNSETTPGVVDDFILQSPNTNKILFATVFVTGAAVLIIEVAAVRVLSPIYGSSLYVLSSVLTVVLAALSLGYWYGGKRADREHSIGALYTIITFSGVSILVLLMISKWLLPVFGPNFSVTTGPLLFSFGLFFIPAFLLGIVSPYIIKLQSLITPSEKIGSVVGATFFWGTFGSIVGSLATGFIFIPHMGVVLTIAFVSVFLMILGTLTPILVGRTLSKRNLIIVILATVILSGTIYSNTKLDQNIIYESEGIYSHIKIEDVTIANRQARFLFRDTNPSSSIYLDSKELLYPNLRFSLLYKSLVQNPTRALFLGGGAYTAPRTLTHNDPDLIIDVVEIEPELFILAQKYFDLDDVSNITNYVMDARVFLQQYEGEKYDLIFVDVFSTNLAPPFHLTTKEFYEDLAKKLSPDGVIMVNTVGSIKEFQPSISGSLTKTIQSVFPTVVAYGLNKDPAADQNIVFVAGNNDEPININYMQLLGTVGSVHKIPVTDFKLQNELVLTDDHAPVEYLMAKQ
jgi:predicted membrane-bound spermidine synthase